VGTCSTWSAHCRDDIGDVGLVYGLVLRVSLLLGRVRKGLVIVGTSLARSAMCRYLIDEVGLM